ncbi:MAG: phosphate ABC transporter ATP-binding protein [Acidimicrobiales bacterium]
MTEMSDLAALEGNLAAAPDQVFASSGGTLEARNVSAWFGKNLVLQGVSMRMEAGQVTSLIGPSGCGKSTYLRTLNRMHEVIPGSAIGGEVMLDGVDVYGPKMSPASTRLKVGMVFQKPNPFPTMSIAQNVISGLKLARIRRSNQEEIIEHSLTRAGLWREVKDRLRTPGGDLSGGQQQRLCIARALAVEPRVLLMDEPCSALDPASTRRIEETIREIAHQVTVVIVTHNMQQALRVSDRCAFFLASETEPGMVVEADSTTTIFTHPSDPRTEDYINGRFG